MVLTTQKFLNWLLKDKIEPLTEDGIIGGKTNNAISLAISKLKQDFNDRCWDWNNNFNFIGIRTDNDFDDKFEDWFVLYAYNTIVAFPCSTVAGVTSIYKYVNLWINGRKGVGTIKSNQQIDYLLVESTDKTFFNPYWTGGLGFLYQDKPIDIYRGAVYQNNKWVIDTLNLVLQSSGNGMNVHSWFGFALWIVGNLSEGCQVTREEFWKIIFNILVANAKVVNGQKRITYSLIQYE